jgi:dephospho-CoA kinase
LETIVHPHVMEYISTWFDGQGEAAAPAAVVEAALWHRMDQRRSLDLLITVLAGERTRLRRLRSRGLSEDQARSVLGAQGSMPHEEDQTHWVVVNDGTLEELRAASLDLVHRLRQRARH